MSPAAGTTPVSEAPAGPSHPGAPGTVVEGPGRPARRVGLLAALVLIVLLAAAAGYWALAVYDSGPHIGADVVAEIQVAGGGWSPVDAVGPADREVAGFLAALEGARALWPPRLLFE